LFCEKFQQEMQETKLPEIEPLTSPAKVNNVVEK